MKTQDIKNIATALKGIREAAMKPEESMDYNPAKGGYNQPKGKPPVGKKVGTREAMKPEVKKALAKSAAASEKGKKAVTLPKAPFKMEDAMDPVDKKELKGKHKDRKDKDIDNDGDVDSSDKFLHKRRKAVSKAMAMASKKKPSAEKDADVEVQEAATHKPNNGADAEDGLTPNGKKMMAMKTPMPDAVNEPVVDKKTFDAIRASGKKAAMRSGDNAKGESKIKPSATSVKEAAGDSHTYHVADYDWDKSDDGHKEVVAAAKKHGVKMKKHSPAAPGAAFGTHVSFTGPKKKVDHIIDNHVGRDDDGHQDMVKKLAKKAKK